MDFYIIVQHHVNHPLTIWLFNTAMENHLFLIGKPAINGPFSMAMLNDQRVYHHVSMRNNSYKTRTNHRPLTRKLPQTWPSRCRTRFKAPSSACLASKGEQEITWYING
jgi:hypothetical protein